MNTFPRLSVPLCPIPRLTIGNRAVFGGILLKAISCPLLSIIISPLSVNAVQKNVL